MGSKVNGRSGEWVAQGNPRTTSRGRWRRKALAAVLTALLWGCGGGSPGGIEAIAPEGQAPPPPVEATGPAPDVAVGYTVVADSLGEDPAMAALIRPYRDGIGSRIQEVVGEAAVDLTEGRPEGNLGNFAADALLWATDNLLHDPAQLALMNNGGLRIPLARGPITVGKMFELMPFENMVSVLVLTGEQVAELAGEIAARGGEPIAGFSFRIATDGGNRVARDILVAGDRVDPEGRYRLVTNDYLANGGDDMPALTRPVARTDYPLLVRDAFIGYLRAMRVIDARIEGRITGEIGR